jgi:plasmid stability protein
MTQITIHNVDDHVLQGLKQIAWQHGVPFDESLRQLLSNAVDEAHLRFSTYHQDASDVASRVSATPD